MNEGFLFNVALKKNAIYVYVTIAYSSRLPNVFFRLTRADR